MLSADLTTRSQSRIEAWGSGTFAYSSSSSAGTADVLCEFEVSPEGGGAASAVGNPITARIQGSGTFDEPESLNGAVVEPAGSYTVVLDCKQAASNASVTLVSGDMNLISAAP